MKNKVILSIILFIILFSLICSYFFLLREGIENKKDNKELKKLKKEAK
jgi:preprotein translocase subunit YajC